MRGRWVSSDWQIPELQCEFRPIREVAQMALGEPKKIAGRWMFILPYPSQIVGFQRISMGFNLSPHWSKQL